MTARTRLDVNEDAVASAFSAKYADTLRFDHEADAWFEYTGDHWRKDRTRRALQYCRELARTAAGDLDPRQAAGIRKAAFAGGVERLARADPLHAVTGDAWDADPWLLGCPRGTVDLTDGTVRKPDPGDGITRRTAVAPFETADCPLWLSFLDDALGGDQGAVRFLQQFLGYCLTGSTREHALVFAHGPGGNGKSVLMNTVTAILGDYATTAPMETFTASRSDRHPTDLAMLRGARLVSASETEEGRAWAEARLKQLTGGDAISARFMRQDFFTYTPQFKLFCVGNHKPVLVNLDAAARRRINLIPFTRTPANPDRHLEEKLRTEWPFILRWMIDGCLDWQENGLVRPESVIDATAQYFNEQDVIGDWLSARCIVEPDNPSRWEPTGELFASWKDYAVAAGESAGTQKALAGKLQRFGLYPGRKKLGREVLRIWFGVELMRPGVTGDGS